MSISIALSNAYSGLFTVSKNAEIVSSNVANARTENYSRQEAVLSNTRGGVAIKSISRAQDAGITATRRAFDAEQAGRAIESRAYDRISGTVGLPGEPGALATLFSDLEVAFVNLQNAPDSGVLQGRVVNAAKRITEGFRQISDEISATRLSADKDILRQVGIVNESLRRIESLNKDIRTLSTSDQNAARLQDERQALIDKVNSIIPVRLSFSDSGDVSLFARGGVVLLNGSSRELTFSPVSAITPAMSYSAGSLSGISVEGTPINVTNENAPLGGGALAANLRVRDVIAPGMQTQLDALARDFIERFQNSSIDTTLAAGDPALITDDNNVFSTPNELGLSSRLKVNALVDITNGGELWRLRDGLGAASPGFAGDAALVSRLKGAFSTPEPAQTGMGIDIDMSSFGFASEISSLWISASSISEERLSLASAALEAARQSEIDISGVDTDQEMQALIEIEQAYAANARVISVVDQLMQSLLEI